jgi:hypothetical protein
MAAKSGNRGDHGNTRIRFIMLEADGDAADLHQIAQAISQAVRPAVIHHAPPALPALPQPVPANGTQRSLESPQQPQAAFDFEEPEPVAASIPTRKSSPKKRKLRTPEVLDLDLTSGEVPFTAYYQERNPTDHIKRYLVIAAWFKQYRQTDEISVDHIYTCYRILNLNVVDDVGSIFRGGKSRGWFHSGEQSGWYAINHVGINQVNNLRSGE